MSSEKREILWQPVQQPGLEHLVLSWSETKVEVDGFVLGIHKGQLFRCQYRIELDTAWKVSLVAAKVWNPELREVILKSDGIGNWSDPKGLPIPELDGSIDTDITVTPFTNTIPIRRLQLQKGQSTELLVAYINVPELKLSATKQRYTCLEQTPTEALYRYEGLATGFQADVRVDQFGLVIDYPKIWTRIYP